MIVLNPFRSSEVQRSGFWTADLWILINEFDKGIVEPLNPGESLSTTEGNMRLTDGRNKPAAAFENFERSLLGVLANGIEDHIHTFYLVFETRCPVIDQLVDAETTGKFGIFLLFAPFCGYINIWFLIPSQSSTFQMLAAAIAENNLSLYKPITPSNTHWLDWPEGGKL